MDLKNNMTYKLFAVIVVLLLLVIFTLQNTQMVNIKFFFWTISLSSSLVILFSFIFGLLIGWLVIPLIVQKKKKHLKETKGEMI